jgi:hypothetical protein
LSLFASTLAEVELDASKMDHLLAMEERPEDVMDLANLPLLLVPKNGQTLAKIPDEYEVLEWAGRYTSVEALREHFGTNHNKLWGDLQASTSRRLYKTLLPRALLELSKLGKVQPQDLAPLAYQARVAAKLYARERCTVPARISATLFDGFRQWIKYGKFQAHGMTYDQLWEKYAEKIVQETEVEHFLHRLGTIVDNAPDGAFGDDEEECDLDYEDVSEQVCRKILERACVSNEGVDALSLKGQDLADETELQPEQRDLLNQIRSQLEEDMYQLLLPPGVDRQEPEEDEDELPQQLQVVNRRERGKFRLVRRLAKQRRFWKLRKAQKELAGSDSDRPWKKSRSAAWLSRSKKSDSDSETVVDSDEETTVDLDLDDSDDELKP